MTHGLLSARRASLVMASGTLASRITGFLRTAALAYALGVSPLASAYGVASTVPTVLLVLVTGGSLSAVLVPLIAREEDLDLRRARAESLAALICTVTGLATVLAVLLSPVLSRLYALGLRGDPVYDDFVRVTTVFLVVFAPQVLAYGLSVHAVAVLQAAGRLGLAGAAPVLANLVATAGILGYTLVAGEQADNLAAAPLWPLAAMGAAASLGVVLMAALQMAGARRTLPGFRLRLRLRRDDTTREVLRLGSWTVLYVVANQLGLAVVLVVATSQGGGAGSAAYQWAFALMQLPYAVIAVSVLSALYPRIARAWGTPGFVPQAAHGLRLLLVLMLPAGLALVVLAEPLTRLLLGHGSVDAAGLHLLAAAVRGFGIALLPFTIFQLLTRTCYAAGDTRRPALVNVVVNVVNVAGAGMVPFLPGSAADRVGALATAYAASYAVGCVLLGKLQARHLPGLFAGIPGLGLRLLVLGGVEGAITLALATQLPVHADTAGGAAVLVVVPGALLLALHAGVAWTWLRPALR